MKIAIVINKSWNIYNFRMCLVKAFLEEDFEVFAIAPEDEYSHLLVSEGCQFIPLEMEEKGSNPIKDLRLIMQLYKLYKSIKPHAILHYTIKPNIYGTIAARLLHIPSYNNVSGLGTVFLHKNYTSIIAKLLYRFSFQFPEKVFFQNKDDLQLFVDNNLIEKNIADLLPGSGINLNTHVPEPYKRNHEFTFLVIARVLFDKGIVEYVEAAKQLKKRGIKAKFQILGYTDFNSPLGISKQTLNDWIQEKLIEYLGHTNDVRHFINLSDCVVLPSYREGTPRTLLEAASLGKPLIATDVPGCREVVRDEFNGYLCKVKNSIDLAEKMAKMYQQEDNKLIEFGKNSRKIVEDNFNEELVVEKYFDALQLNRKNKTSSQK